jgi:hypothetical protein
MFREKLTRRFGNRYGLDLKLEDSLAASLVDQNPTGNKTPMGSELFHAIKSGRAEDSHGGEPCKKVRNHTRAMRWSVVLRFLLTKLTCSIRSADSTAICPGLG